MASREKTILSRTTTPGSGLLLSTGGRYFRPPACLACGLTADRPWACAEPLHQDDWDVGRAGNRQGHRRDLGGWPAQLRSRKRPQGPPRDRGRRFPGGGPGRKPPPGCRHVRTPRRHRPGLSPLGPGDPATPGRGGAGRSGQGPAEPAVPRPAAPPAPRLPHLALLAAAAAAAAASGPAGSDADAQAQTARAT